MESIKIGREGGGGGIFQAFILEVDTVKKIFLFTNLLRFAAIFFFSINLVCISDVVRKELRYLTCIYKYKI